jgi:hypothetical protein
VVGVANTLRTAITDSAPGSGRPSVTTYLVINQGCHAATRHQLEADLLLRVRMHASCDSCRILPPVLSVDKPAKIEMRTLSRQVQVYCSMAEQ